MCCGIYRTKLWNRWVVCDLYRYIQGWTVQGVMYYIYWTQLRVFFQNSFMALGLETFIVMIIFYTWPKTLTTIHVSRLSANLLTSFSFLKFNNTTTLLGGSHLLTLFHDLKYHIRCHWLKFKWTTFIWSLKPYWRLNSAGLFKHPMSSQNRYHLFYNSGGYKSQQCQQLLTGPLISGPPPNKSEPHLKRKSRTCAPETSLNV